jgi:hypothetical protein
MELSEAERKMLTEYLGECWHERADISSLRCVCGELICDERNRTFTTPPTLPMCMRG